MFMTTNPLVQVNQFLFLFFFESNGNPLQNKEYKAAKPEGWTKGEKRGEKPTKECKEQALACSK